jgi:hypothetical protein
MDRPSSYAAKASLKRFSSINFSVDVLRSQLCLNGFSRLHFFATPDLNKHTREEKKKKIFFARTIIEESTRRGGRKKNRSWLGGHR